MEIFYWEKAFHAGKKIRKNDFAPSEFFSYYAPGHLSEKGAIVKAKIYQKWV